jgi:hypothetical protein
MRWLSRVKGAVGKGTPSDDASDERAIGAPDRVLRTDSAPIKSPPMQIDGRCMSASEFVKYIEGLEMPQPLPTRFFLHHTWIPTRQSWKGHSTLVAMKRHYERQLWRDSQGRLREGWTVGPHLFVADDGIWLFSDIRYDGVGVYGHNYLSRHLEMVGDYNDELPTGETLRNTIVALGVLHEKLGLDIRKLYFHRDFSSKSCPGWAVQKSWIIPQVERWIQEYRASRRPEPPPVDELASLRAALERLVANLVVEADLESTLTAAAEQRGLIGPLTQQIPVEIQEQGHTVQFFVEALLAPSHQQDEVLSLGEFERARNDEEQEPEAPEEGAPVRKEDKNDADDSAGAESRRSFRSLLLKSPPTDPHEFTGRIR